MLVRSVEAGFLVHSLWNYGQRTISWEWSVDLLGHANSASIPGDHWLIEATKLFIIAGELPDAHLKPFGWGKSSPVEETFQLLSPKQFFVEYALGNKPLVMREASKVWPAFENWKTDKYFMSVAPEKPYEVTMEIRKGDPNTPTKIMEWKDFLRSYNTSKRRMVAHTPNFILQDVLLPTPLQCDAITENEIIMGHKMWFGNKYTTSQVHKDAADNINCLVYGVKNYTIVSPEYQKYVLIDRPNGLYSTMDVDKVDLEKYPGLDKVEYLHAELQAGDCIFVPYKWIHQVRSYGRNIAVNVWWNYWKNKELELDGCSTEHDSTWDISKVSFTGWADFENRDSGVQEHIEDLITMAAKPVSFSDFVGLFLANDGDPLEMLSYELPKLKILLNNTFEALDGNSDSMVSIEEVNTLSAERMKRVIECVKLVLRCLGETSVLQEEAIKASERYPQLADPSIKPEEVDKLLNKDEEFKFSAGLSDYIKINLQQMSLHDEL